MSLRNIIGTGALTIAMALSAAASSVAQNTLPDLSGTWQADTPDGPQTIIVRADSSASFGEEIVRWRVASDTVYLALGGEWLGYNYALRGQTLTLSGGDLVDPIALTRVGPPTPLPAGVTVPPDPDRVPPETDP